MSNSNLPEKRNEVKTWLGQFLVDLKHIELPIAIEKNLIRSACKLITGLVDIPAAYLHEYKRRIERETEALDILSRANVENIVDFNKKDSELIASTANYYSIQLYKEAGNRKAILEKAIYELGDKTFSEDTNEQIDEDWLSRFAKIANDVSKEEVQLILAKILAGEISKPGSFSLMTLKVLERLDKQAANEFSQLTSHISTLYNHSGIILIATRKIFPGSLIRRRQLQLHVMEMLNAEEYPRIGQYSLLVDIGVLRPFQTFKSIRCIELEEFHIGSTAVKLYSSGDHVTPLARQKDKAFKCLELTTAGVELLPFMEPDKCPDHYLKELDMFFLNEMGYHLIKMDQSLG